MVEMYIPCHISSLENIRLNHR